MEKISKAIIFATEAHKNQYRKGTKTPYVLHVLEVGAILGAMTDDEEVIAAGILHDVLEDTDTGKTTLSSAFGKRILDLVCAESEDKREGSDSRQSWKIRKQETIDALSSETSVDIKMIALADKLSNIRAMRNDYLRIGDALWERFNQSDPREHAWYYSSIANHTRELAHFPAWQEYRQLVEQVFGVYLQEYTID